MTPHHYQNKNHIGLFLWSVDDNNADFDDFKVEFEFGIVNQSTGQVVPTVEFWSKKVSEISEGYGTKQLISHAELFADPNLIVDGIQIQIQIQIHSHMRSGGNAQATETKISFV